MLQDQALKTLAALGQTDRTNAYVAMQLAYAAGLIQGAMERLGVPCSVQVDAEFLPICTVSYTHLTLPTICSV